MNSGSLLKDDKVIERLKLDVGEDVLPVLMQAFKGEIASSTDTLNKSLARSDFALFETTAHALKSAAASFGALRLSDICREMEMAAKGGSPGDLLEGLLETFRSVAEQTNETFGFKSE